MLFDSTESVETMKKDIVYASFLSINETLEPYFLPKYCKELNLNVHCFHTNIDDKRARIGSLLQVDF